MRHTVKYAISGFIIFITLLEILNYTIIHNSIVVYIITLIFSIFMGDILNKQYLKVYNSSIKDTLTSLYNRSFLNALLKTELNRRHEKRVTSILMIDVDDFKLYNDTYGHIAGDTCLKKIAKCLQKSAKRNSDIVVRFGGEEFLILLLDTNVDIAKNIADSIHKNLRVLNIPQKETSFEAVTLSIGIVETVSGASYTRPESIIDCADQALYIAKNKGKNQTVVYNELVGD